MLYIPSSSSEAIVDKHAQNHHLILNIIVHRHARPRLDRSVTHTFVVRGEAQAALKVSAVARPWQRDLQAGGERLPSGRRGKTGSLEEAIAATQVVNSLLDSSASLCGCRDGSRGRPALEHGSRAAPVAENPAAASKTVGKIRSLEGPC